MTWLPPTLSAAAAFLRWLCIQLVSLLLRPAFIRAVNAYRWGGVPAQERFERRFDGLVNAADCWPCRVEWDWSVGCIWITSAAVDAGESIFDLPEGAHFA